MVNKSKRISGQVSGRNHKDVEWTSDTVSTEFNYLVPTIRRIDPNLNVKIENENIMESGTADIKGDMITQSFNMGSIPQGRKSPVSQLSINIDKEMIRPKRRESLRNDASKEPETAALEPILSQSALILRDEDIQ